MSTFYERADADVMKLVARVMNQHHPELHKAGVTVDVLMASNVESHAVMLNGYPCAAVIRKIGVRQRAAGRADCEITIEQGTWNDLQPLEKVALIDHELTHMQIVKDKSMRPKRDTCGRPKLRTRLHDWQLGGFEDIVARYGEQSIDAQMVRDTHAKYEQLMLDFASHQKN